METQTFMKPILIGSLNLSNKVIVSDPCYLIDNGYNLTINDMIPGKYNIYLYGVSCSLAFGGQIQEDIRPSALYITHESYSSIYGPLNYKKLEYVEDLFELASDNIGVDSGTCGIYDFDLYKQYQGHSSEWEKLTWPYNANSIGTELPYIVSENKAVTTMSGWGDGLYRCYVGRSDKEQHISTIFLEFIPKNVE